MLFSHSSNRVLKLRISFYEGSILILPPHFLHDWLMSLLHYQPNDELWGHVLQHVRSNFSCHRISEEKKKFRLWFLLCNFGMWVNRGETIFDYQQTFSHVTWKLCNSKQLNNYHTTLRTFVKVLIHRGWLLVIFVAAGIRRIILLSIVVMHENMQIHHRCVRKR